MDLMDLISKAGGAKSLSNVADTLGLDASFYVFDLPMIQARPMIPAPTARPSMAVTVIWGMSSHAWHSRTPR